MTKVRIYKGKIRHILTYASETVPQVAKQVQWYEATGCEKCSTGQRDKILNQCMREERNVEYITDCEWKKTRMWLT